MANDIPPEGLDVSIFIIKFPSGAEAYVLLQNPRDADEESDMADYVEEISMALDVDLITPEDFA